MPERVFDLSTTVATTPEAVVDFLVDLNRHHGLHPFLMRAPGPLQGYMAGQAEQAHARTFRLLPGVLA